MTRSTTCVARPSSTLRPSPTLWCLPWSQESAFLITSTMILMLGMVFSSRGFNPGSTGYTVLTLVTALLLTGSCIAFIILMCFEITRSAKVSTACDCNAVVTTCM